MSGKTSGDKSSRRDEFLQVWGIVPDRVQLYRGNVSCCTTHPRQGISGNASCCTTHPRQGTSISGECVMLYGTSPTRYKYIGGMCRVVRHIPDTVQVYRGNVSCCTTHPRQGTSISGNASCCTTHPRQGISGECFVLYDTSPTGYIGRNESLPR
ncbi:hypothetical protein Bbelb_360300 [Branchiostoma belcheri]|nr:hypothetical protein Bbelb_360300 [Branchiostoma belcheri]